MTFIPAHATPEMKCIAIAEDGTARIMQEKPRHFVRMFQDRFAGMVERGEKLHTVRPWPHRLPRQGDTISLRAWTGAPYRSKQRILREATITKVDCIEFDYSEEDGMSWWEILINGAPLTSPEAIAFSKADGFDSLPDMANWFRAQHGLPFFGIVIHWSKP